MMRSVKEEEEEEGPLMMRKARPRPSVRPSVDVGGSFSLSLLPMQDERPPHTGAQPAAAGGQAVHTNACSSKTKHRGYVEGTPHMESS